MQVATEQQAAHVPVTEQTDATHEPETPMDVDQESKGTVGSMKRKAEEGPPEESKKAKVGACTSQLLSTPRIKIEQNYPTPSSGSHWLPIFWRRTDICVILQRSRELHGLRC
jgi:hypothetical protein